MQWCGTAHAVVNHAAVRHGTCSREACSDRQPFSRQPPADAPLLFGSQARFQTAIACSALHREALTASATLSYLDRKLAYSKLQGGVELGVDLAYSAAYEAAVRIGPTEGEIPPDAVQTPQRDGSRNQKAASRSAHRHATQRSHSYTQGRGGGGAAAAAAAQGTALHAASRQKSGHKVLSFAPTTAAHAMRDGSSNGGSSPRAIGLESAKLSLEEILRAGCTAVGERSEAPYLNKSALSGASEGSTGVEEGSEAGSGAGSGLAAELGAEPSLSASLSGEEWGVGSAEWGVGSGEWGVKSEE